MTDFLKVVNEKNDARSAKEKCWYFFLNWHKLLKNGPQSGHARFKLGGGPSNIWWEGGGETRLDPPPPPAAPQVQNRYKPRKVSVFIYVCFRSHISYFIFSPLGVSEHEFSLKVLINNNS